MAIKDVVIPLMKHDVMVGRGRTIASKLIDAHTEMKLLLDDLIGSVVPPPTAPGPAPPTGSGIVPKLVVAFAVSMACGAVSASYPKEGESVAVKKQESVGPLLDAGMKAMMSKDWDGACQYFLRAVPYTKDDPDESMGRIAECYYYAGKPDQVLATCRDLEVAGGGKSKVVSFWRGMVARQKKDYKTARVEFKLAEKAGHPTALIMLGRTPDE